MRTIHDVMTDLDYDLLRMSNAELHAFAMAQAELAEAPKAKILRPDFSAGRRPHRLAAGTPSAA